MKGVKTHTMLGSQQLANDILYDYEGRHHWNGIVGCKVSRLLRASVEAKCDRFPSKCIVDLLVFEVVILPCRALLIIALIKPISKHIDRAV